jgi:hypothetical protein
LRTPLARREGAPVTALAAGNRTERPNVNSSLEHSEQSSALLAFVCVGGAAARPAGAVALGGECEAFRRWVDGLAAEGNEAVLQIRQYGFTYDLAGLRSQLCRALLACPQQPAAARVGRRLLELLSRLEGGACLLLEESRCAG